MSEDAVGQYFEAVPTAQPAPRTITVNVAALTLRFETDSGVFSPGRLDPGTRLLLTEAPEPDEGDRQILDLGCGWGAIACVTALRCPAAQVWAVDVNERALALTARNAKTNRAPNVVIAQPGDVDPTVRFDRILCNPPIRVGKPVLQALLGEWLDRLVPDGTAQLVVHRHLGSDSLARWLHQRGHEVTRLMSRSGYRLLEVRAHHAAGTDRDTPSDADATGDAP